MIETVFNYFPCRASLLVQEQMTLSNDSLIACWLPETHMQNTLKMTVLVK